MHPKAAHNHYAIIKEMLLPTSSLEEVAKMKWLIIDCMKRVVAKSKKPRNYCKK
jgi:hypothetical protein